MNLYKTKTPKLLTVCDLTSLNLSLVHPQKCSYHPFKTLEPWVVESVTLSHFTLRSRQEFFFGKQEKNSPVVQVREEPQP